MKLVAMLTRLGHRSTNIVTDIGVEVVVAIGLLKSRRIGTNESPAEAIVEIARANTSIPHPIEPQAIDMETHENTPPQEMYLEGKALGLLRSGKLLEDTTAHPPYSIIFNPFFLASVMLPFLISMSHFRPHHTLASILFATPLQLGNGRVRLSYFASPAFLDSSIREINASAADGDATRLMQSGAGS